MKTGFIAGAFDLIHPGYILMFKDAKTVCDYLIVAIQEDPSLERPHKLRPVHNLVERTTIISSIEYVDGITHYRTEKDLYRLLTTLQIDIRILGSDYKNRPYNGDDLDIPVYFHERSHDWSYTSLRKKICTQ